ncbi:conserved uncharacterized protein, DUF2975 [Desulfosarcina variabilis str. Montpellier]
MQNRERIQRASRRLRMILNSVFWAMPVVNALVWIFMNHFPDYLTSEMLPYCARIPLPASARLMGFAAVMIPTGVAMTGAFYLMRLFKLYEQGEIFKLNNVHCYKKLSRVLIWWFIAGILCRSLLTTALTLHHPPGQRMISFGLTSTDLTTLLVGLILMVIAWVMEEGRKLQEDQDLTV